MKRRAPLTIAVFAVTAAATAAMLAWPAIGTALSARRPAGGDPAHA